MVKTCCVKNCDIPRQENVTCFRLPNSRLLKRKWIDAIGLTNKLTSNSRVCIKHFREDDYDFYRGRPRLKSKVIPSVFCESDKQVISPCTSEEDLLSNEINTDITLKNIQKLNLDLSEGDVDVQNKTSTELSNNSVASVDNESSRELRSNGQSKLQNECNADVQTEVGTELQHNGGTTDGEVKTEIQKEGRTELQNDNEVKSQNTANADIQSEPREELHSNKDIVQSEGSTKIQGGCSVQNENENVKKQVQKRRKSKRNGVLSKDNKNEKGYQDSFIESTTKPRNVDNLSNDIEDIIVNYQIKQNRPVHGTEAEKMELGESDVGDGAEVEELNKENDPVFIEVAVQGDRAGSPRDCLMVLESVQVELDPSAFLADGEPDDCHETVDLAGDDDDHSQGRRPDPISLLTSSDEDEVIIQEPHIDTVEVSDETDEDDMPLVKLLKKPKKKKKKPNISLLNGYKYFCMDCQYTATSKQNYREHIAKHSTILQVCEICDYTTASKGQFSRHKRKHREDRKYRCHLCDYKARHNMSLIYHLKSHLALSSAKKGFKCDKCGFQSDVKTVVLKHVKLCSTNVKKYSCDKCVYETKRPSDLKRHKARRHNEDQDDDEEFVP